MHIFILLVALSLHVFSFAQDTICYFTPPKDWQEIDPKMLSSVVQTGYFTTGKSWFHPSINLAVEKIDNMSCKEYVSVVKKLLQANPMNTWRDLGSFQIPKGTAKLTQLTQAGQFGPIEMFQLIIVHDCHAYILTGAALKEEFSSYREPFLQAFRSITFAHNLYENLSEADLKNHLLNLIQTTKTVCLQPDILIEKKEEQLIRLQSYLTKNFQDMGVFWQKLVVQDLQQQILQQQQTSLQ